MKLFTTKPGANDVLPKILQRCAGSCLVEAQAAPGQAHRPKTRFGAVPTHGTEILPLLRHVDAGHGSLPRFFSPHVRTPPWSCDVLDLRVQLQHVENRIVVPILQSSLLILGPLASIHPVSQSSSSRSPHAAGCLLGEISSFLLPHASIAG